jgi:methyl-accepting chemotaxis protein
MNFFSGVRIVRLKLGHKLIGLFLVMALLVLITGIIGMLSISKVRHNVENVITVRAEQLKQVVLMKTTLQECRVHLFEIATTQTDLEEFSLAKDDFDMKITRFAEYINILSKGNAKLKIPPAPVGSPLEKRIQSITPRLEEYKSAAEGLIAHKESLLKRLKPGVLDAQALSALADPQLTRMVKVDMWEMTDKVSVSVAVDDLLVVVMEQMKQAAIDSEAAERATHVTFIAVIVAAIAIAITLGLFTTRYITRRIRLIGAAINQGAQGDLTTKVAIQSRDELGELAHDFNLMVERLADMMATTKQSMDALSDIAATIHTAAQQSSQSSEIQAAGVNSTSTSIIEISASINEVARSMDTLSTEATNSSSSTMQLVTSITTAAQNVEKLADTVEEVSSSITEMASSIREIDASVSKVVESTMLTASSVATLDSSISQIQSSSSETARITNLVRDDAEKGKLSVEATIAGINEIKRSSAISTEAMAALSGKAGQIGSIIAVIDDIAEQTNLLALNAAIIAAQAGEHGKGFAVVATEIKSLADRTRRSTKEITDVIKGVQDEVSQAVRALELASRSVAEGEELSLESGSALNQIVDGVRKASAHMDDVVRVTEEQAKESQRIRLAMDQVADMIGQIARATNEQGRGSELIMTAVEQMKDLNFQVSKSTKEQNIAGAGIANATEKILAMIQQARRATFEQSRGSEQIIKSVEEIKDSTEVNLSTNQMMEESVRRLTEQTELLNAALDRFTIAKSDAYIEPE